MALFGQLHPDVETVLVHSGVWYPGLHSQQKQKDPNLPVVLVAQGRSEGRRGGKEF
jgi:hypothetical protein